MSAKIPLCLLAVVCLLAAKPVDAYYPASEYLELASIGEVADEYGVIFNGIIRNTHPAQNLELIRVRLVLKKDAKVIYVEEKRINKIYPGDTERFVFETVFKPEEYDEFYIASSGWANNPSEDQVKSACDKAGIGDCRVYLIDESVSIGVDVGYAEIHNNTPSVVDFEQVSLKLLDVRGNLIGFAASYRFSGLTLLPYEKIGFLLHYVDLKVSSDKIADWEFISLHADFLDIPAIATTVDGASWGEIKAAAMGR